MNKLEFKKLQNNVQDFLKRMELLTAISINLESLTAPSLMLGPAGQPIYSHFILVGDGLLPLILYSMYEGKGLIIINFEILQLFEETASEAQRLQQKIKSTYPTIHIQIKNSFDDTWNNEGRRLMKGIKLN